MQLVGELEVLFTFSVSPFVALSHPIRLDVQVEKFRSGILAARTVL